MLFAAGSILKSHWFQESLHLLDSLQALQVGRFQMVPGGTSCLHLQTVGGVPTGADPHNLSAHLQISHDRNTIRNVTDRDEF